MTTSPRRIGRSAALLAALAWTLVACNGAPVDAPVAAVPAGGEAPSSAQPLPDQPAETVPPATAPPGTQWPLPPDTVLPAAGTITFSGFGPASFGADAEAVRQAWGGELDGPPGQDGSCHYLIPPIEPGQGYAVAFMIEGGRFVRIDVDSQSIAAPGGGAVGMDVAQIESLYPALERRAHKYVEGGHYLRIVDPAGGNGVLVFEAGADGIINAWRIGVPPPVDYIEGCS